LTCLVTDTIILYQFSGKLTSAGALKGERHER
jgi:hypothetical protein